MEWYIMNANGVRGLVSGLGKRVTEDCYTLHDECTETLEELLAKLESDDSRNCVIKHHLLAEQIINRDLLPMIKFANPDVNELQLILKLLTVLCEPVERDVFASLATSARQDINNLTKQVLKMFLHMDVVEKLMQQIMELIEEAGEYEMAGEGYQCIHNLLTLVRNVLFAAQSENPINRCAITGTLLKNQLGSVLMFAIKCHDRDKLVVPVSQVLSLLFKNFQWSTADAGDKVDNEEWAAQCYIDDKLKKIIVQLLQGSLSTLVLALRRHDLMGDNDSESYMSWCIAFFLQFINEVPTSVENISGILSNKCLGYLVYKVSMLHSYTVAESAAGSIATPAHSNMFLIFSALDSIITTATSYRLQSLDSAELKVVLRFYKDISQMKDLWQIMLYYIRSFDTTRMPRSFLAQLVCLNHQLLMAVEFHNEITSSRMDQDILSHISQYASPQVVNLLALLVDSYTSNSLQTNLAVFTMLCHICVDCMKVEELYTPALLRALGTVSTLPSATTEDKELANYITQSFLDDLTARPEVCMGSFFKTLQTDSMSMDTECPGQTSASSQESADEDTIDWTEEEESDLFSAFASVSESADPVSCITNRLRDLGVSKSEQQVKDKLCKCGLIGDEISNKKNEVDLTTLVGDICSEGNESIIAWLQNGILTASYVKSMPKDNGSKLSPLCRYSVLRGHGFPMLPYSEKQEMLLKSNSRVNQLINYLGLYDTPSHHKGSVSDYPVIPNDMSAGKLYTMAERIRDIISAPIDKMNGSDDSCGSSLSSTEELLECSKTTSDFEQSSRSSSGIQLPESKDVNLWLNYMQGSARRLV